MADSIQPLYEVGNSGLITRKLNLTGNDYIGEPKKWFSDKKIDVLVSVSATFSYEPTNWASGNNPAHVTTYNEPTGTGTLTLFYVGDEEWQEILPVDYNQDWGVGFGADKNRIEFGFAFDVKRNDDSKTKIFIPRCQITGIPEISTTTNTKDGVEIQQVEIPIQILSVYKNDERMPIYYRINSKKNTIGYTALQDTLIIPKQI
jgi:hypothetical protein